VSIDDDIILVNETNSYTSTMRVYDPYSLNDTAALPHAAALTRTFTDLGTAEHFSWPCSGLLVEVQP